MARQKNNYFGVLSRTYQSMEESFIDHGKVLHERQYRNVVGNTNYRSTLTNIKAGGYAEAVDYVDVLCGVIESVGLTIYDRYVLGQ